MTVSRAQRKAANRWDSANMVHLATKVRRDYAELVKATAQANGETVNAIIRRALDAYLMDNGVTVPGAGQDQT